MLILGVLFIRSSYTWVASFVPQVDLGPIVESGTFLAGSFYTVMLASVYIPTVIALEWCAWRLKQSAPSTRVVDDQAWRESIGLTATWKDQLLRLTAVAAPLLSSHLAGALG